jgi:uncharacterized phiE125 gp8 family phage protein
MLFEVTAPTEEPVTLQELKDHLRVFHSDEDALITSLIEAARKDNENFTHRAFVTQTWQEKRDGFPCDGQPIRLPKAPLSSTTAPVVTYIDQNGDTQTWSSSNYTVDYPTGDFAERGRIRLNYSLSYPQTRSIENAVTIQFVCGYGAASAVPEMIKACLKETVRAAWARGAGDDPEKILKWVDRNLWPYKSF